MADANFRLGSLPAVAGHVVASSFLPRLIPSSGGGLGHRPYGYWVVKEHKILARTNRPSLVRNRLFTLLTSEKKQEMLIIYLPLASPYLFLKFES